MKILHILPYIPVPPIFGGALRIFHILDHLQQHHDVTIAALADIGDVTAFKDRFPELAERTHLITHLWRQKFRRIIQLYSLFTNHSYWYNHVQSQNMQSLLNRLYSQQEFDMVQAEFPSMAFFDVPSNATKILDCHNVEYDNYRRMSDLEWSGLRRFFYQREYTRFYHEEIAVCRKQDALFVTCQRDQDILDRDTPEVPKYIIPNGVDLEYFHPLAIRPEPYSLVFTGTMGYVPNYDAMLYFLDEIFPVLQQQIPGIRVYIVGNNPPDILAKHQSDQVIITGFVEDVRPFIARAAVYIVPLRMGGGTRLKVLEALSMQKPVVTTTVGCEGIDVSHEETALIADEPAAFAEAIIRLLKDQRLRQQLTHRGYQLVREKYDWRVIGDRIEDVYHELNSITDPVSSRYPEHNLQPGYN